MWARQEILLFVSPCFHWGLPWLPGTEEVPSKMLSTGSDIVWWPAGSWQPRQSCRDHGSHKGSPDALILCMVLMLGALCQAVAALPRKLSTETEGGGWWQLLVIEFLMLKILYYSARKDKLTVGVSVFWEARHLPCTGREIPNHWTTREIHSEPTSWVIE